MFKIDQTITSLEVAELMGRTHKKVLESIRLYISQMEEIEKKNETGTKKGWLKYFINSSYIAGNGQEQPCYNVTKIGCEFLAHKLKGIKGTEFTMRYIDRFHKMEESISISNPQVSDDPMELLKLHYQALEQVDSKVDKATEDIKSVKAEIESLRDELPLFPCEADKVKNAINKRVIELLGGKESNAYKDISLRKKVFANCYQTVKGNFEGIGKYTEIKRKYRHEAVKIAERYELPFFLAEQIENANAQQSFNFEDKR